MDAFDAQKVRGNGMNAASVELGGLNPGESIWSVMLETFTQEGHADAAARVLRNMVYEIPALSDARVQTTTRGSMIVYGRYTGPEDPRAQSDLKKVKDLEFRGHKVFRKAILTRVEDPGEQSPITGNDLRALRQRYPKIHPLYTLQVAAFMSTPQTTLSVEQISRKAEAHAMMLRTQGHEAYFQVDSGRGIAVVTIGAFDHTAYDPRSTLYAPEIEMLLKKFPHMLVNGEPMHTPIDPKRPRSKPVPMAPRLVEVPR